MTGPQSVLEAVHSSCAWAVKQQSQVVQIDKEAVKALAAELKADATEVQAALRGLMLPIKFDSLEQEVTLIVLYHLLDGGSGYDSLLLRRNLRDAHETVEFGVIGMHMGGGSLDATFMKNFSMQSVHNYFGIDSMEEHAVMPGVMMSKPGALHPLAKSIVQAMSETGSILADMQCRSLGQYIIDFLTQLRKGGEGRPLLASQFVEELADTFPVFNDTALLDGKRLVLHRKAQELAADLHVRFGATNELFCFADIASLAADSGSTVPAVLRAKGVLKLSDELASTIDADQELPAGLQERVLRAAAVRACDAVVEAAGGAFNAVQLGGYLSFLTEEGRPLHSEVKRHKTPCFAY